MSIKKNKNQLIISMIVGVAIAVASYQVIVKLKIENENLKKLTSTSASVPIRKIVYVVAKTDIKKGDTLESKNLTTKQFPIEIEGAIASVSQISGLKATKDIKADSPIVEGYFKASDIDFTHSEPQRGYRAVAIRLDTLPPFIKSGSHVDIYFSKNAISAQDVKVLDIVDIKDSSGKYIMLEIKDRDVPVFITAVNNDKAVLIQRNRHERTGYKFSAAAAQLPQFSQSAPPRELVELSDVPSYDMPQVSEVNASDVKDTKDIPVVKSNIKNEEEIEFISGDKKIIVGAPL